jgi:hypothetical protein
LLLTILNILDPIAPLATGLQDELDSAIIRPFDDRLTGHPEMFGCFGSRDVSHIILMNIFVPIKRKY